MDTKEAQEMMRRVYFKRDKARGVERTLLRTFHELGELSDAILREKGSEAISDEIADVFAWLCSLANLLEIDLSDSLLKKYNNSCSRCGEVPCECTDAP